MAGAGGLAAFGFSSGFGSSASFFGAGTAGSLSFPVAVVVVAVVDAVVEAIGSLVTVVVLMLVSLSSSSFSSFSSPPGRVTIEVLASFSASSAAALAVAMSAVIFSILSVASLTLFRSSSSISEHSLVYSSSSLVASVILSVIALLSLSSLSFSDFALASPRVLVMVANSPYKDFKSEVALSNWILHFFDSSSNSAFSYSLVVLAEFNDSSASTSFWLALKAFFWVSTTFLMVTSSLILVSTTSIFDSHSVMKMVMPLICSVRTFSLEINKSISFWVVTLSEKNSFFY